MPVDFIYNDQGYGGIADRLLQSGGDVAVLRPFVGEDGRSYYATNAGGKEQVLASNTPATLTGQGWTQLDNAVLRSARSELNVWKDLVTDGLTFDVPGGMATTVLQYRAQADFMGAASISMNGLREGYRARPVAELRNFPLPLIHEDFSFDLREMLVATRSGMPLDTLGAEMAGRRIAEKVEDLTIGLAGTYAYGGGTVYGFTNNPGRITYDITSPLEGGWTPKTLIDQINAMIQTLQDKEKNGPYGLYFSRDWAQYLNMDYSTTYQTGSLMDRVKGIDRLKWVRTVYRPGFTGFRVMVIQRTPDVCRAITFLPLQVIQWQSPDGMEKCWKAITGMVPQIREDSDADGNSGYVDGYPGA